MLFKKYDSVVELLAIFMGSLILFSWGLNSQEIIGFDSRFYLFVQEMWRYGASWFPMTYHSPYPDYPASSTFVIYVFALLAGGVNKLIAVLPTAILAAITLTCTYLIGGLHAKRWGLCAVFFILLTGAFVKNARSISLDIYPTAITALCFYLIYSADKLNKCQRKNWIYPLLFLGFVFRGPIGLVIPAGVISIYYLSNKNYKQFFYQGLIAFLILCMCTITLLMLAYHVGGSQFMQKVLQMEILGRMDNAYLPRYFYFTNSLSNYALTYPVALLVMLGAVFYKKEKPLFLLIGWMMVILLGMSIPDDKKIRYILPMVPAISLLAAYLYIAPKSQVYFNVLRSIITCIFFIFPSIVITAMIFFGIQNYFIFVILQLLNIIIIFFKSNREVILLGLAAFTFMIFNASVLEVVQIKKDKARDFVQHIEDLRMQQKAHLVFYHEQPDGLPIKYLINMKSADQPRFVATQDELIKILEPAFFVTSESYYKMLSDNSFHIIGSDTLGHVPVIVFAKK